MDKARIVALHEASHAVVAEVLGIQVKDARAIPNSDGSSGGSIRYEVPRSEIFSRAVVLASGYAGVKSLEPDYCGDGHGRDFQELETLAQRFVVSDVDVWREAHSFAYQIVREPRVAHAIEYVADELVNRAAKGLGMSSAAIGAVIVQANDEYDASRRLYGQRAPRSWTLSGGMTPSEEQARRAARLKEIGATRQIKRSATTKAAAKRKVSKRKVSALPGFNSPGGFLAAEDFGAVIKGKRSIVHAGQWFPNGHPIVVQYVTKFRAVSRKPTAKKAAVCPSFA